MRVHRLLVTSYVARHARLWLLVRVTMSVLFVLVREHPLRLATGTIAGLVVLCAFLNVLEMARRHEFELLANLGVSRVTLAWWALMPPLLGETALLLFRR
jgi:hypothetical protein